MDCIYYSFLAWLLEIGDDGDRHQSAGVGFCVAAMLYVGSISAMLQRLGVKLDVDATIYSMVGGGVVAMIYTFLRYIDHDRYIEGLVNYRQTPIRFLCRRAYWVILLSPAVLALAIYIKWHT